MNFLARFIGLFRRHWWLTPIAVSIFIFIFLIFATVGDQVVPTIYAIF